MSSKKKLRVINHKDVIVSDINHLDEIAEDNEESFAESDSDTGSDYDQTTDANTELGVRVSIQASTPKPLKPKL